VCIEVYTYIISLFSARKKNNRAGLAKKQQSAGILMEHFGGSTENGPV